ncbi:MAG TPA: PAS domain-containing protein [Polyangiaceae bacterium]|nr:PAS domain-containing protein [Polyangiaceae bacterium]
MVRTPRAVYESMARGDLIDALVRAEAEPLPHDARRLEALLAEHVALAEELRLARERSERAEIARATFADLFAQAPLAYCVLDRNGTIEDANDATATLFCTSSSALAGAKLVHLVELVEKQTFANHIAHCMEDRARVLSELTMTVRGRGEIAVQMVSTPRVRENGWVDACRTIFHDVTRARRASAASEFLARLDDAFGDAAPTDDAATAIAHACIPMLGHAAFVDLVCDDRTSLRRAGLALEARYETARDSITHQADDPGWHRYVARVIETGSTVFEPSSAAAFSTTVAARAFLLVPLVGKRKTLGVLGALRMDEGAYTVEQLELAYRLARRAARAIDNAITLGAASPG